MRDLLSILIIVFYELQQQLFEKENITRLDRELVNIFIFFY